MAQNESGDDSPLEFTVWRDSWWEAVSRAPFQVDVVLDEPIQDGSRVLLTVEPAVTLRDAMRCQQLPHYGNGYEIPILVLSEALDRNTAFHLETALTVLRNMQGLDPIDGLRFLFFTALINSDWNRAKMGRKSFLLRQTWSDLGIPEAARDAWVMEHLLAPEAKVEFLLHYWDHQGAQLAMGFAPAKVIPGRPTYRFIPPLWLSREDLKRIGKADQEMEIPVLIKASLAPILRHFSEMFVEQLDLGRPIQFSLADRNGDGAETSAEKVDYMFQRQGNVWQVVYGGHVLPPVPTDLGGYFCIHYLLLRPRKNVPIQEILCEFDRIRGKAKSDPNRIRTESETLQEELSIGSGASGGLPCTDDETIAQSRARIIEIDGQEFEAEAKSQFELLKLLRKEREDLRTYLSKNVDLRGKPKVASSSRSRSGPRLANLLNRAYGRLDPLCPKLVSHLKAFIHTGMTCSYEPDKDINWQL